MRPELILTFSLLLPFLMLVASVVSGSEKTLQQGKGSQVVHRAESQKPFKGSEDWFSGDVEIQPLFPAIETAHFSGAYVTFQPGARTAWHLHPAGQHLIVTSGVALTGTRDGNIVTFESGDTVWCPPHIDHWHGATPDAPMTHLAITGFLDGKNVVWKEKVTDEQYYGKKSVDHE